MRCIGSLSRPAALVAASIAFAFFMSRAEAVPLNSLKGQGFDSAYGDYAPGGNCLNPQRITLGPEGFTFRSAGQSIGSRRFEYAVSYLGPEYDGISAVFFPFPVGEDDFGSVVMTINDNEQRGVIRLESEATTGAAHNRFPDSLSGSSPFVKCGPELSAATNPQTAGTAESPASGKGLVATWNNLAKLSGRRGGAGNDTPDLLADNALSGAIKARLGS